MKKIALNSVVAILVIVAWGELCVRLLGISDFPIYQIGGDVNYIPKPNQRGIFFTNDWYFNDKSMPIKNNFNPAIHPDVLLIGNSIVMGGNTYRQDDKLTSLIQDEIGANPVVWPLAVGGWTQINEMGYIKDHPEIAAAPDFIAWEYMSGGLSHATPWAGELVFPTHSPHCAICYAFSRYVLPHFANFALQSELPMTGAIDVENARNFDASIEELTRNIRGTERGIIWLYPTKFELLMAHQGKEWLPERSFLEEIARKHSLKIVDISKFPEWNPSLYKGDGTHPGKDGNKVLARILSSEFIAGLRQN